jgi:hypothetical protein
MSVTGDLLQRIVAEKRSYDQTTWPPATKEAIDQVRSYTRDVLQAEPFESDAGFLRCNDRLNFNGHTVYGATEHEEPFLGGFHQVNASLADPPSQFVYYGGTDHTLYAQERTSGRWVALDVPRWAWSQNSTASMACWRTCCVKRTACE